MPKKPTKPKASPKAKPQEQTRAPYRPFIAGALRDVNEPRILDCLERKDLLPAEFDLALAGVSEPTGNPVYNVEACCSIIARVHSLEHTPDQMAYLDDLMIEREKSRARRVVLVSFGCVAVSNTNQTGAAFST